MAAWDDICFSASAGESSSSEQMRTGMAILFVNGKERKPGMVEA